MPGGYSLFVSLLTLSVSFAIISGELGVPAVYTGALRLVNDSSFYASAGRLEIYLNDEWGTICSNGFGAEDATLACNQLGYSSYQEYGTVGELRYPTANSRAVLISNLACSVSNPSHLTIYHCPHTSGNSCSHNKDVTLSCTSPYTTVTGALRFVSKRNKVSRYLTSGRVDIFFAGRWGTICSVGLTLSDAQGLCHHLTGSESVLAYGAVGSDNLEFDQGLAPVWIENIHCSYNSTVDEHFCSHSGIGITNCTHRYDLAMSCLADGATRLVSAAFPLNTNPGGSVGRLEIYHNGQWGTVCDDSFNVTDADVVCNQLGYSRADRYGNVESFGYGVVNRRIWLDDVNCNSSSLFLANCSHSGFGIENCANREDVAISCSKSEHDPGRLRFVNSTYIFSSAGRLEIYLDGHWGTICGVGFGPDDATLACNQLGYERYQQYGVVGQIGYPQAAISTPIHVSNLACDRYNSSHLTIYHCPRSAGTSCSHNQDVALICMSPYSTATSAVRLVSNREDTSSSLTAGRVEIFFAGRWGTICSDNFLLSDAMGLCHIFTFSSTVLAYGAIGSDSLEFNKAPNSTPVWIQNFHCMYHSIDRRYYCDWDGLGITNCTHDQDLALSCRANGAVRLISGPYQSSTDPGSSAGRLEIYHNGIWGTVCENGFDQTDADVVCRQLGYERADRYGSVVNLGYIQGTGTIWLDNVRCTTNDVFLAGCSHSGFSKVSSHCGHRNDVGISCTQEKTHTRSMALSTGALAGIIIGVISVAIVCIVVSVIIIYCVMSRRSHREQMLTVSTGVTAAGHEIQNTNYEPTAPKQDINHGVNEPPPPYVPQYQKYHYLHPEHQYVMQQQYPEFSQYPQYPPPPHPLNACPGYYAEQPQPY